MVGGGVVLQNENLDKKNIFYAQEILNYWAKDKEIR
jgi:hypothetical protein